MKFEREQELYLDKLTFEIHCCAKAATLEVAAQAGWKKIYTAFSCSCLDR